VLDVVGAPEAGTTGRRDQHDDAYLANVGVEGLAQQGPSGPISEWGRVSPGMPQAINNRVEPSSTTTQWRSARSGPLIGPVQGVGRSPW
jgi:hypothetical protein